jgi:hypothetical protein
MRAKHANSYGGQFLYVYAATLRETLVACVEVTGLGD